MVLVTGKKTYQPDPNETGQKASSRTHNKPREEREEVSKYRKALVAGAGFLGVLSTVLTDGILAPDEYESVLVALATAVSVYLVPNRV